jgi:hypothetical protein
VVVVVVVAGGRGHVVNTYLVSVLSSELEYIFVSVSVVQLASWMGEGGAGLDGSSRVKASQVKRNIHMFIYSPWFPSNLLSSIIYPRKRNSRDIKPPRIPTQPERARKKKRRCMQKEPKSNPTCRSKQKRHPVQSSPSFIK